MLPPASTLSEHVSHPAFLPFASRDQHSVSHYAAAAAGLFDVQWV